MPIGPDGERYPASMDPVANPPRVTDTVTGERISGTEGVA